MKGQTTIALPLRILLLVIIAMALSQIMCNAPSPIKSLAVKSIDDLEMCALNSGIFDVTPNDVTTQQ
jgi:hypothetical protein